MSRANDQTPVRTIDRFGPRIEIRPTPADVAAAAAHWLATNIRTLAATQPQVSIAVSGGRTPQAMLQQLVRHQLPWDQVLVYQVDERCVPLTDERRNAHQLLSTVAPVLRERGLLSHLRLLPVLADERIDGHPSQIATYLADLPSRRFDIVHLGLGDDGHTASLVPDDAVLSVTDAPIARTGDYQGTQRFTLTYPSLLAATQLCWVATGESKAPMVARLIAGDRSIPAGSLAQQPGVLFTDVGVVKT